MSVAQESSTRKADFAAANTANPSLLLAIEWLQKNTPMSRMTQLEISETIRDAVSAGVMTFKWGATTIP